MSLAPNLLRRQAMIHAEYPDMTIYSLGDTQHQAEKSDHNKDARGIWHALDIMTKTDTAYAGAALIILAWLLSDTTDLQYVIHDDRIYGRNEVNGWKGAPYDPTNPKRDKHKDHVHVSSKHGPVGKNAATGTGYDTAAEKYTPPVSLQQFMEDSIMPTADEIAKALLTAQLTNGSTVNNALVTLLLRVPTNLAAFEGNVLEYQATMTPAALGAAVIAALPPSVTTGLTEDQVGAAVHAKLVEDAQKVASALAAPTTQ